MCVSVKLSMCPLSKINRRRAAPPAAQIPFQFLVGFLFNQCFTQLSKEYIFCLVSNAGIVFKPTRQNVN